MKNGFEQIVNFNPPRCSLLKAGHDDDYDDDDDDADDIDDDSRRP